MSQTARKLQQLIERAATLAPVRVAVVNAAQAVVLEAVREGERLGFVKSVLIGDPVELERMADAARIAGGGERIVPAQGDHAAVEIALDLVRARKVDVLMKGMIHTDAFVRPLLDAKRGLRRTEARVSHAFVCDVPSYSKLLVVTDAAINIAPDLNAKAQILENAIGLSRLIGVESPKAAVLSAVETVNPAIVSTLDAAALTLMARRGQIAGAVVEGPLAFDNAISLAAAREKAIESPVAGECDILLVPDLVAGNVLAKALEYLAGATAAGVVLGLSTPVVLSSRSDPTTSRVAGLALAALIHHSQPRSVSHRTDPAGAGAHCAPSAESACCPLPR